MLSAFISSTGVSVLFVIVLGSVATICVTVPLPETVVPVCVDVDTILSIVAPFSTVMSAFAVPLSVICVTVPSTETLGDALPLILISST